MATLMMTTLTEEARLAPTSASLTQSLAVSWQWHPMSAQAEVGGSAAESEVEGSLAVEPLEPDERWSESH